MSTNDATVLPLPELPKEQQGTSTASHKNYTASVSNAAGYLCHINLDCHFDVPPEVILEIFCHPDNAGAFRDIKCVGYRKVKQQEPGYKVVEVEQCGELRVLWIHRVFRTYLDVTEDARDPECLKTEFTLLRSDLLSRFHGSWELRPKRDEAGNVVGCHAVLNQDVLPKGVPTFFAHLPVLGGMLRRVSLGTIQRLVEDILNIVKKYTAGKGQLTVDDVIAKIAAERGHKTIEAENREGSLEDALAGDAGSSSSGSSSDSNNNGASDESSKVASFAIESFSDSESETVDDSDVNEQQQEAETAAGAKLQQLKHSSDARSSSGGSSGRQSADGVVTITPSAPNSKDGTAAVSPTAEDAAAVSKGLAAAVCAELPKPLKQQQRSHKQHKHATHKERPAVGVLLDVTVHEHVHVSLIPNPEV